MTECEKCGRVIGAGYLCDWCVDAGVHIEDVGPQRHGSQERRDEVAQWEIREAADRLRDHIEEETYRGRTYSAAWSFDSLEDLRGF